MTALQKLIIAQRKLIKHLDNYSDTENNPIYKHWHKKSKKFKKTIKKLEKKIIKEEN